MIDLKDNRFIEERYEKNFAYYRDYSDKIESDRKIEENTAKEYKGREILEFLQNAADAAKNREGHVRLSLSGDQLIIENSGNPFNIDGVRSLFSANFSIKRVKKSEEFIGYKGLGFRSILNFSKDVKIFSEKLSIGYNLDNVREFQRKLIELQPEIIDLLDLEEDEIFLPFFCAPKILNEYPELSDGMCTKIVAKVEPKYLDDVKKQIKKIGESELIFNNSLSNITVDLENDNYEINLELLNERQLSNNTIVQEVLIKNTLENKNKKFFVYSKRGGITLFNESKNKNEERKYIVGVAFAENPLDISSKKLISYFSTDINNPFPFMINATFELTADRNRLYKNNPFNIALLEKLNQFIFDVVKMQYKNESKPNYDILKQLIFFDNKFLTDEDEGYNFGKLFNHNLITDEIIPTKNKYCSLNQGLIKLKYDFYSIISKYPNYDDLVIFSDDIEIEKFLSSRTEIKNITSDQLTERLNYTIKNTNISREEILELSVLYFKEFGLNSEGKVIENLISPRFFVNNDNEYIESSFKKYIVLKLKGDYQKICKIIGVALVNEEELSLIAKMCKKHDVNRDNYDKCYSLEKLPYKDFASFVATKLDDKDINIRLYSSILKYFKENYTLDELSAARKSFVEDRNKENKDFYLLFPIVINNVVYKNFVCFNISRDYDILYYKFLNSLSVNGKNLPIHYFDINDDYEFYNSIGVVQLDHHVNEISDTIKRMDINTIDIVKESNKFLAVTNQTINSLNNWKIISEGEIKSADAVYRYDRIVSDEIYKKLKVSFCDYEETFGKYSNKGKEILENKLKALSISELFERACKRNYVEVMYKIFEDNKGELPRTFSSNEVKLYSGVTNYSPSELFFDNNAYALILPKLPAIKILSVSRYSEYGCSKEFFEYLGVKRITEEVIEEKIRKSTDKIVLPFLYFTIKKKLVVDDEKSIFGEYKYYSKKKQIEEGYLDKINVKYLNYSDACKKMLNNGCTPKMINEYLEAFIKKMGYELIDEDCVITELINTVNDIDRIKECSIDIYKIMYNDFYLKGKIPVDKIKNIYLPTIDGEYISNSEDLYYMLNDELLDDLKGKKLHIIHLDFVENNKFYYDLRIQQLAKNNFKDMIEKTGDKIKLPFLFYVEYDEIILRKEEIEKTFGDKKYINKDTKELSNILRSIDVDFIDYYLIQEKFEGKLRNPKIIEKKLPMYLESCGYKFISEKHVNKEIINKIKNNDDEINDFAHKYYYTHIFNNKAEKEVFDGFRIHTNNGYKLATDQIVYILDKEWNKWIPGSLNGLNIEKLDFDVTTDYYAKLGVKKASKDNYIYIVNEQYNVIPQYSINQFTSFVLKQPMIDYEALPKIKFHFNINNQIYHCDEVVYTNDLFEQRVYKKLGQPWISRKHFEQIADQEKITTIERYVNFKKIDEPDFFDKFLDALKEGLLIEQAELIKQLKKFHSNKNIDFENKITDRNILPSIDYYTFDENKVDLLRKVSSSIKVKLIKTEEEQLFKVLGKNELPDIIFYSGILESLVGFNSRSYHFEKIKLLYRCFKDNRKIFDTMVKSCDNIIDLFINKSKDKYMFKSNTVYFGREYGNHLLEKVLFAPYDNFLSSEYLKVLDDNTEKIVDFFMSFGVANKIKRYPVTGPAKGLIQYKVFAKIINEEKISVNENVTTEAIKSFNSTMKNALFDDFLEYIDVNQESIFADSYISYYYYSKNGKDAEEIRILTKSINEVQLLEGNWVEIDGKHYSPDECTTISEYDLSPIFKYSLELEKYKEKKWISNLNVLTRLEDITLLDFYEILCEWKNNNTKKTLEFYSKMCRIYENKSINFAESDTQKAKRKLKFNAKLLGCKNEKYGYYNYEDLVIVDRIITNHYLSEVPQFMPDYNSKQHLKSMFDIKYISEVIIEEARCEQTKSAQSILDFLMKKINYFGFLFKDEAFSSKINFCFLKIAEFYINGVLVKLNNYEYLIDLKKSIIYFNLPDEISDSNSLFENHILLKIIVDAFVNLCGEAEAMTILTILLLDEQQVSTYLKMIDTQPSVNKKEIKFNLVKPQKRSIFSKIKYLTRR